MAEHRQKNLKMDIKSSISHVTFSCYGVGL